jgi:hypothetical protein
VSINSLNVSSGSPRSTKSRAGYVPIVARGIGVTWVPKAMVTAPRLLAKKTPYESFCNVGPVTCVT